MSVFVCKWWEDSSPTFCDDLKQFSHYAFRVHDLDKNADGSPVKTHYHGCIYSDTHLALSTLIKRFPSVHFETMRGSRKDGYDYLTHKNNPEKAQYSIDGIITDKAEFWQDTTKNTAKKDDKDDWVVSAVLTAFENKGRFSYDQMRSFLELYGRDFVFNYNKVLDFAQDLYKKQVNETHDKLTDLQYRRLLRVRTFRVKKEIFYNACRLSCKLGRKTRKGV